MLNIFFKNADGTFSAVSAAEPLPVDVGASFDASGLATEVTADRAADALETIRDNTAPVPTYGPSLYDSDTFTRPADTTAYASGDLVANSTTAGSVAAMTLTVAASSGGKGLIRSVKISKAGTATASLRAHFYQSAPTAANGDNGAWSTTQSGYLGFIDVSLLAFSDGAAGVGNGEVPFDLTGTTDVRCLLEARGAYTPTSASAYTVEVTSWPEA